jgi:septal ring factor EnvC (AmiA/AmiB activator)
MSNRDLVHLQRQRKEWAARLRDVQADIRTTTDRAARDQKTHERRGQHAMADYVVDQAKKKVRALEANERRLEHNLEDVEAQIRALPTS